MPTRTSLAFRALILAGLLAMPPATRGQGSNRGASEDVLLEVKFADPSSFRLRGGRPAPLRPLATLSARRESQALAEGATAGLRWMRLTDTLPEADLDRQRSRARPRKGRPPPDMNNWFRAAVPAGQHPETVLAQLRAMGIVEYAGYAPRPAPPPLPPDYTAAGNPSGVYQGYLDAAPNGVDARYAWTHTGGDGAGVQVVDVEYDFNAAHLDLPAVSVLDGPINAFGFGDDHGTAVLGILGGLHNAWGVRGIAHGASLMFVPAGTTTGGYNPAGAILTAAAALSAGDVLLIEQQTAGPNGGEKYVPLEWIKSVYDAVVFTVSQGISVVAAAGNGAENLDAPVYSTGNGGHWPFLPQNDSGAILVGAANPPSFPNPRSRSSFSTYGSTVDLQGWGNVVLTTGYGSLYASEGKNLHYTATFSGTSSASPMVAGAAAALQGVHLALYGVPLTPAQVREILRATGTPQSGSANIGPQPNLRAAIDYLLAPPDGDGDGVSDLIDNCVGLFNPGQEETDDDGVGDACDNCPLLPNPDQRDLDSDELGDPCDPDPDNDGLVGGLDNCPMAWNPDQADTDGDGLGDACDPCFALPPPAAFRPGPGSPGVTTDSPSTQNRPAFAGDAADRFDFNLQGGFAETYDQCGFGRFGRLYVNHDTNGLYLGAVGCDVVENKNAMILFLGAGSRPDNRSNLWDLSGAPAGLDFLHNVAFASPMDIAIVLGDEWGDDTFPNFDLGNGYNFGQGAFYLGGTTFAPVPGARLGQFDGTETNAVASGDDDGNQLTDRWELFIPWSALQASSAADLQSLQICGVMANDAVGGFAGLDRYLSGNFLGQSANAAGGLDLYNNIAFGFVTLTPVTVLLDDLDLDGLPDAWELLHAPDLAVLSAGGDADGDGMTDGAEYQADTLPRDITSRLRFTALQPSPAGPVLAWRGGEQAVQVLYQALPSSPPVWTPIFTNLPPTPTPSQRTAEGPASNALYRLEAFRP